MTALSWGVVAVAGAAGALLRHELLSRATDGLHRLHVLNVAGAGLLGLLLGAFPGSAVVAAFGAGGLGALTSFSTWVVLARGRSTARELTLPMVVVTAAALGGTIAGRALGATP